MKLIRGLLVSIGILAVLLAGIIGVSAYGYSQVKTDFEATNVSVKTDLSPSSLVSALVSYLSSGITAAISSVVQGVEVQGSVAFENPTFVPLYIPAMAHTVLIDGIACKDTTETSAFWLSPNGTATQPFDLLIATQDLPQIALSALASHGSIDVEVESLVSLGPLSWTKTSTQTVNPLVGSSGTQSAPQYTAPSITSGWYVGSTAVSTVAKGASVTASVNLSGGTAGSYTLEVRRDISLSPDSTIQSLTFDYNGASATKQITFTPPYATNESGTTGYHLDLLYNGSAVWTMADSYPPRLTVSAPIQTTQAQAFSLLQYAFNPVSIKQGSQSTLTIAFSGGSVGTYTINFKKDVTLAPDQLVSQYNFQNSGTSGTVSASFTPTDARTYHFDISYNGQTVWSQPDDSTRLQVTSAVSPFAVTQLTFSPISIKLGSASTLTVTISGGTAGTYDLRFWKDITIFPDQQVGSYSFQYNGVSATVSVQFTPPSTGTYHVDLQSSGTTLWSQQKDASQLQVS
jgi:LEA14-like dessication related protein